MAIPLDRIPLPINRDKDISRSYSLPSLVTTRLKRRSFNLGQFTNHHPCQTLETQTLAMVAIVSACIWKICTACQNLSNASLFRVSNIWCCNHLDLLHHPNPTSHISLGSSMQRSSHAPPRSMPSLKRLTQLDSIHSETRFNGCQILQG